MTHWLWSPSTTVTEMPYACHLKSVFPHRDNKPFQKCECGGIALAEVTHCLCTYSHKCSNLLSIWDDRIRGFESYWFRVSSSRKTDNDADIQLWVPSSLHIGYLYNDKDDAFLLIKPNVIFYEVKAKREFRLSVLSWSFNLVWVSNNHDKVWKTCINLKITGKKFWMKGFIATSV